MPSETRANLVLKMAELGEPTPAHWTVLQIRSRLSELKAANPANQGNTLKSKMVELNKMAKKKPNLIQYAESLGLEVTNNMTIAQIYGVCEAHLNTVVAASPLDKMGFGQHRDLTYIEVLESQPSYTQWTISTMEEDPECGWRL